MSMTVLSELTSYGRPHRTMVELAVDTLPILIENAHLCSTITYEDVAGRVGIPAVQVGRILDYLYDHALAPLGLPELWAVVVNKGSGMPNPEVLRVVAKRTDKLVESATLWRSMVLLVHAYPWDLVKDRIEQALLDSSPPS
jgi:alkylated DNA nucleotide flippase Atl1